MSSEETSSEEAGPETTVLVRVLPHGEGLPLPSQASAGSAGFDLRAAVDEPLVLEPGAFVAVPTGLAFALPDGWEGQVRPRSGLARNHGVTVLNSPGTVDSDYRGEIQVILIHHGPEPLVIERGHRIAQMVFARLEPLRRGLGIQVQNGMTISSALRLRRR